MTKDEKWMEIAIEQAKLAIDQNEIPVGAVLVQNDRLISEAHNQPITNNDPTAHAEIQLLRKAGIQKNNYRLIGSTLYVTLEPCAMCFGAMIHARIERMVFGGYDYKSGVCGSSANLHKAKFFNHSIDVIGGILEKQCVELLQSFFQSRRNKNPRT